MKKLSPEEMKKIKPIVYLNYQFGDVWKKYLINYGFFYIILIFILFKIGVIRDSIFLNWISDLLSYFVPLIDVYANKYDYYAAANLYSFLVIGLFILTCITLKKSENVFIPFIDGFKNKVKALLFKIGSCIIFGFVLWVGFSEIFVSVQYTCVEVLETNRVCLGMQATPSTSSVLVLFLLFSNYLVWCAFIAAIIFSFISKDILIHFPRNLKN